MGPTWARPRTGAVASPLFRSLCAGFPSIPLVAVKSNMSSTTYVDTSTGQALGAHLDVAAPVAKVPWAHTQKTRCYTLQQPHDVSGP